MFESFGARLHLFSGDCLALLPLLPENSVDAVVTDPPYHLTAGKKGGTGVASLNLNSPAGRSRVTTGFMGKGWDGGDTAFRVELWREVLRVLKPGAHLLSFGGSRTYHRMAMAVDDAGFEIRDQVQWLYGQGFPKSLDVSKAIDKAAGAEREVTRERYTVRRIKPGATVVHEGQWGKLEIPYTATDSTPATAEAAEWDGWGTALKPACEPIVLARKPLSESTVAANVLKWGTGALNIDGCRAGIREKPRVTDAKHGGHEHNTYGAPSGGGKLLPDARWPANVIHDGSDEVLGCFPNAPGQQRSVGPDNGAKPSVNVYGDFGPREQCDPRGDSGSAARFFYCAKASAKERNGSKHPTIKPLALMRYLVRLVTPPDGLVLDPFGGSGTTGEAAFVEGFRALLAESDPASQQDIRTRLSRLPSAGTSATLGHSVV